MQGLVGNEAIVIIIVIITLIYDLTCFFHIGIAIQTLAIQYDSPVLSRLLQGLLMSNIRCLSGISISLLGL